MMRGLPLPDNKPTFGDVFRDHGYVTGHGREMGCGISLNRRLNVGLWKWLLIRRERQDGLLFMRLNEKGEEIMAYGNGRGPSWLSSWIGTAKKESRS